MEKQKEFYYEGDVFKKKKNSGKTYERFGAIIRHLTLEETGQLFDSIDNYKHKLMFEMIYELGCRVGEFTKIQLKHLDLQQNSIFFPAANTKTRKKRTSFISPGLMNELKAMLQEQNRLKKRKQ